ncbi:hypothetical protein PRUPE_6G309200 [Prunus persica]|uniref:Pectinesterase inhibitor domain-containing protein n=1 Tax=Prunus persica TaxID=3760 RepID=M5WM66_PRUPE|nr:putative invertase inhibitor [Prunus persica]ONI04211.1 hypothetical protein PRUPE_6G309200 [Prunus persica]
MASANAHCCINLLPLALVIFILFNAVHPCLSFNQPTRQRIDKVYHQMEEYGFCDQTFTQNIKTPSADFARLTQVALDQTTQNAASTHAFILQLLSKITDKPPKNALTACESAYCVVMQAFLQEAVGDFNRKDYDSMLEDEGVAPRAQASCEITFITPPSPVDPLKEIHRQMGILIAMAVVTGHELLGHRMMKSTT